MALRLGDKEFRLAKVALSAAALLVAILFGLTLQPAPLFAHILRYEQFVVYSDRPLGDGWETVLTDVERRLATSELYNAEQEFRIFVCNEPWRLWLLTRSTEVGGFADTFATRNIYIREAIVEENRIAPPRGTLADADVRSLAYFIAHESVHVMQSRIFGRMVSLTSPKWLVEGYADYAAKAGDFDFAENRQRLIEGDPLLSERYAQRGLYRRYHLMVEQTLRTSNLSAVQVFADPPDEGDVLESLAAATHSQANN